MKPRYKNRDVRSAFVTMGVVRSAFVTMGVVRSAFVTMGVVRSASDSTSKELSSSEKAQYGYASFCHCYNCLPQGQRDPT